MPCPRPRTTRTGELECPQCGLTWGRDDLTPLCWEPELPSHPRPKLTERARQASARQEIEKLRAILGRSAD